MSQIPIAPNDNAPNDAAPATGEQQVKAPEPSGKVNPITVALVLLGLAAFAYFFPVGFKTTMIFIVTLSILVFVHEWGHYQFARWAGMKVNRFAIGFPPFIYTKRYNGIDYSIGALPIGGMVDIAGLGSEEEMVHTVKGEGETPVKDWTRPAGKKQFQDANLGWRFLTLFAGPLMNFILAIVVSIALFSIIGVPNPEGIKRNLVGMTLGGSPAAKAGVQMGDLVVGVGKVNTDDTDKIMELIRATPMGETVDLQVKRNDKVVTLPVKPTPQVLPVVNKDGKVEEKEVPAVGISFSEDPASIKSYDRLGIVDATKTAFIGSFAMSKEILNLVKRAFTGQMTAVDKGGIGGPVAIAKMAKSSSDAGPYTLLLFGASLSINLGLLNLLPLPALDGGRILFLGYELIMRRPLDPRKEGFVHMAGMVLLLAFMLFITLRDVIRL